MIGFFCLFFFDPPTLTFPLKIRATIFQIGMALVQQKSILGWSAMPA